MNSRTAEDFLRNQYFDLLPDIKRITAQLEAEVKYDLRAISKELKPYERLEVHSRIKDCESAVDSVRRHQEGATFDKNKPEKYSLTQLPDLAGVRVLVFPRGLICKINETLLRRFQSWTSDPVKGFNTDDNMADKYFGHASSSDSILGEIQIVPMLTGLFWEVEHAAIYKPKPEYKGVAKSFEMKIQNQAIVDALKNFEATFEKLIKESHSN